MWRQPRIELMPIPRNLSSFARLRRVSRCRLWKEIICGQIWTSDIHMSEPVGITSTERELFKECNVACRKTAMNHAFGVQVENASGQIIRQPVLDFQCRFQ